MKKILFLTILVLFFKGCEKKEEPTDFKLSNLLTIKDGSKLIQGRTYKIIWNTAGLEEKKFYCNVIFHYERLGKSDEKVLELHKLDSNKYLGEIFIPKNTSWVYISLSTPYASLNCPYSVRLPVFKNEKEPEFGANSVALLNSDTNNYIQFFYKERSNYPDNYSIYLARWSYEASNQILNTDTIIKQLKELEKINLPEVFVARLIGNSIIMNYSEHQKILNEIAERLKFSPIVNNWEAGGFLIQMLLKNFDKDSIMIRRIIDSIISYNPFSYFTKSLIDRGEFANRKIINPSTSIKVLNRLLQKDSSYYLLIKKGMVLSVSFLPDSIKELRNILHKVVQAFKTYNLNENTYFETQDFFHKFYSSVGLLPYQIKQFASFSKEYLFGINLLKEIGEHINGNLSTKGIFFYNLGELYENLNVIDSALKYYYHANLVLPSFPLSSQKLNTLIKKTNFKNFEYLLKDLKSKFGFPYTKILNFPKVEYYNGKSVSLINLKQPKILVFYSLKCSFCDEIIRFLADNRPLIKKNNIVTFFITTEPFESVKNLWFYKFFDTDVIINARRIKDYFALGDEVPQVICINSNNFIVNWLKGFSPKTDITSILETLK